jgi:hypothetical protein
MLEQVIKKNGGNLYERINRGVADEKRIGHLQVILEDLSLTNIRVDIDEGTAIELLSLPLTTTVWSLILKIIPKNERILM